VRFVALALCLLLIAGLAWPKSRTSLVILNARLLDTSGLRPAQNVLVRDGKIEALGHSPYRPMPAISTLAARCCCRVLSTAMFICS